MEVKVSPPIRYGVLAVVALLAGGLVWLGVARFQAERQTVERVELGVPVGTSGGQAEAAALAADGDTPVILVAAPQLAVHVTGAVAEPGVYRLAEGARVGDAVAAAGGALPNGMAETLNLAARLSDGDKVYIPTQEEAARQVPATGAQSPAAKGATQLPVAEAIQGAAASGGTKGAAGPVSINTATATELQQVKGIGPTTAARIIEYRAQNGPFQRVDDLTKVKGIGAKTLEQLRPQVKL